MRMYQKYFVFFLCLSILLGGCGQGTIPDRNRTYIYYVNGDGTGLVKEEYDLPGGSTKGQISAVLEELRKETESIEYKSVYPKYVRINSWELRESDLEIDFSDTYNNMDVTEELLLRAATVHTLEQIGGVDYIKFTVEGEELRDSEGKEEGYMNHDSFVENTGSSIHTYQEGSLHLFFANETGDKLTEEIVSVRYNSNMSVEKLITEQLIKGPSMEGAYPTLPPETKILGVSVRDGICYVNFDEGFLDMDYKISPQVRIYSVVNSIVAGGETGQVQILVNGKADATYQGSVGLEKPLSRNLEIVEEKKKD